MVVVPASSSPLSGGQPRGGPTRALVIDRQQLFLAALGRLLAEPPISAEIRTASRSDLALELTRNTRLDLVCCELRSEPVSGTEVVRILAAERPELPVILLGDAGDEGFLAAALASSVAGLFTKNADPAEFRVGVNAVLSGHRAIGSAVIGPLLARYVAPGPRESRRLDHHLSPTELEILEMIGRAQSIPVIAATRGISHKTVRNHLAKIYRKLELHGRTEAMLWATRMGLTGS